MIGIAYVMNTMCSSKALHGPSFFANFTTYIIENYGGILTC